jgi:hypothetical protein
VSQANFFYDAKVGEKKPDEPLDRPFSKKPLTLRILDYFITLPFRRIIRPIEIAV